jgi:hypothetical protein
LANNVVYSKIGLGTGLVTERAQIFPMPSSRLKIDQGSQ